VCLLPLTFAVKLVSAENVALPATSSVPSRYICNSSYITSSVPLADKLDTSLLPVTRNVDSTLTAPLNAEAALTANALDSDAVPVKVVAPPTLNVPPTETLPVMVAASADISSVLITPSIYKSFHSFVLLPKSVTPSDAGNNALASPSTSCDGPNLVIGAPSSDVPSCV
jgi:hypothetical protein